MDRICAARATAILLLADVEATANLSSNLFECLSLFDDLLLEGPYGFNRLRGIVHFETPSQLRFRPIGGFIPSSPPVPYVVLNFGWNPEPMLRQS